MPRPEEREGGHKSPPKEYRERGATKPEHYADPTNFKYPIHGRTKEETYEFVRAAIAYFCKPDNYKRYPPDERKYVARRILEAARKIGIEVGQTLRKLAGEAIMERKAILIETDKGLKVAIVKAAKRQDTHPMENAIRNVGKNVAAVEQTDAGIYLILPKPVIREGTRHGRITGYTSRNEPIYGGVFKVRLPIKTVDELTQDHVRDAFMAAFGAATEEQRQKMKKEGPPKRIVIIDGNRLKPYTVGEERKAEVKQVERITPPDKPYGTRAPTKTVRSRNLRETFEETFPGENPKEALQKVVFPAFVADEPGGRARKAVYVRFAPIDEEGTIGCVTVDASYPGYQEGLARYQTLMQNGISQIQMYRLALSLYFSCDRSPRHHVDAASFKIFPNRPPVGNAVAQWSEWKANRWSRVNDVYTTEHRRAARAVAAKAVEQYLARGGSSAVIPNLAEAKGHHFAAWLIANGVDIGSPGHEEMTGHVGVMALKTENFEFGPHSMTVKFRAQNGREATIVIPRSPVTDLLQIHINQMRPGQYVFREGTLATKYQQVRDYITQSFPGEVKVLPRHVKAGAIAELLLSTIKQMRDTVVAGQTSPYTRRDLMQLFKKIIAENMGGRNPSAALAMVPPSVLKSVLASAKEAGIMKGVLGTILDVFLRALREQLVGVEFTEIPDETYDYYYDYSDVYDLADAEVPTIEDIYETEFE